MHSRLWAAVVLATTLPQCADPPAVTPDATVTDRPSTSFTDSTLPDSPDGDTPDTAVSPCTEITAVHSLYPSPLRLSVGRSTSALLRLSRDRALCPARYTLSVSSPVVTVTPEITISLHQGLSQLSLEAISPGRAVLTVRQVDPPDPMGRATTTADVIVLPPVRPECPLNTPALHLPIASGGTISGPGPSPLGPASLRLPVVPAVPTFTATLACANDLAVPGWEPIGPAVRFGPETKILHRESRFSVPVNPGLVPALWYRHIALAYAGPGISPRIVPVANVQITQDAAALRFETTRLGTWQAVIPTGLGTRQTTRHFTWRALLGISMGAVGTSLLGTRHPERFDVIAPLGGPADATFSGDYLRQQVFGGFCTEAQRDTLTPSACATSSTSRTPPADDLGEMQQDFEHMFSPVGMGTGGTFDRHARFQGFRDIARMFGNPIAFSGPMGGWLPFGVPSTEASRSDTDRCAHPVVLGGPSADINQRFYDREYNPDGDYPVITFCDGQNLSGAPGTWSGSTGNYPVEVALAVDRNGNGRRDPGEPVVRNFAEPWRDTGSDGVFSVSEPGYDRESNPDPNGDDYDRFFNPAGRENNLTRDDGEPYDDLGVDGVSCPSTHRCPYDYGEDNHRWDSAQNLAPGADRMNPRGLLRTLPRETIAGLAMWIDGGVRDALQFGVNANHFAGGIAERGLPLTVYNTFGGLLSTREPGPEATAQYRWQDLDLQRIPSHVMLRYGSLDATPEEIALGDGAHVGTNEQITRRLTTAIAWVLSRWPDGDVTVTNLSARRDDQGRCANGYLCSFDFTSERTHRTGPVIVSLPPGYHNPENRNRTYPVVYFLHGYGMEPMGLAASSALVNTFAVSASLASWQRLQKVIMVFPDGRCRDGDNCLEGTFFTNSVVGNAQLETWFDDLYDWVEHTYRVRPASEVSVTE